MNFIVVKLLQVLLGVFILLLTFTNFGTFGDHGGARDPDSGFIIDTASPQRTSEGLILWKGALRPIVAANNLQMVLLGISRFSGFFMYPALILVFFSKFRATGAMLAQSPFQMFVIEDMHKLHAYCGYIIFIDSMVHTIAHISRWIDQGTVSLLVTHKSGISGLVAILSVLLIVLPMAVKIKERIKYEIRKAVHYMFLVMVFALCFHTSSSSIPNGGFTPYVFGTLLVWYALDALYCSFFMTELIHTTVYQTLSTGVQMTMKVSKRFQSWGENGGYGYVCFPWIDRNQWHAFSLFENPNDPEERQIFMQKVGDWTSQVHERLQRNSVRPVWIQGPFPSPYSSSIMYDNQILVASGIGITPALSVIRAHRDTRRINLIWATRDPTMLQFFLEHAYLDHEGWNLIFYTGKTPLVSSMIEELTSTNVCVIKSRPNLEYVIPNIIYGIESGEGLPESYMPDQKQAAIDVLSQSLGEMDTELGLSHAEKMRKLSEVAKDLGYAFSDLVNQLDIDTEEFVSSDHLGSLGSGALRTSSHQLRSQSIRRRASQQIKKRQGILIEEQSTAELTRSEELAIQELDEFSSGRASCKTYPAQRQKKNMTPTPGPLVIRRPSHTTHNKHNNKRQSQLLSKWESLVGDHMCLDFKPWEAIENAAPHVMGLDKKKVLETWGILYELITYPHNRIFRKFQIVISTPNQPQFL